jgi:flagellar basal-body rod protein FlgB
MVRYLLHSRVHSRGKEILDMPQPIGLFDSTMATLQRTLDLRTAQHQALSSNVANADTPHYRPFEVAVEEEMRKQRPPAARQVDLVRTQDKHLPVGGAAAGVSAALRPVPAPAFSLRADGNTVDLDRTMGALADNSLKYKTSAQLLSGKLKSLRNVIQGGR